SNLGSQEIKEFSQDYETMRREVLKILEGTLRPEFLNRIDEVVIFRALDRATLIRIVDIQLGLLRQRLEDRKLRLEMSARAKETLADKGFDPVYGARPLKRTIQQEIQNPLALRLLEGAYKEGDIIRIDADKEGNLVFQ
ncbi:MAG: type VI secretion system ATPase TssH, partial [Candidatus Aminicenantes bacterium]|nr:type VI secretion system ATPase TssH [Candidatus Aminicenantes bacterium]